MLVDWNEGYISVCPTPDLIPVEDKKTYIPTLGVYKGKCERAEGLDEPAR